MLICEVLPSNEGAEPIKRVYRCGRRCLSWRSRWPRQSLSTLSGGQRIKSAAINVSSARRYAKHIASDLVRSLEIALGGEGLGLDRLTPAAAELGTTISEHLSADLLVSQNLRSEDVEKALLDARPLARISHRLNLNPD